MRIFAQEGLGRPDLELVSELDTMNKFLEKRLPGSELPPAQAILVFTHPQVEIDIPEGEEPPAPSVTLKELKEVIKKAAKSKALSAERAQALQDALAAEGKGRRRKKKIELEKAWFLKKPGLFLTTGAPGGQSYRPAPAPAGDAFTDRLRRGVGEVDAHGIVPAARGVKRRARYESHLLLDGVFQHIRGAQAFGQHAPQEQPTLRVSPVYAGGK